jgi:hypothetical protein
MATLLVTNNTAQTQLINWTDQPLPGGPAWRQDPVLPGQTAQIGPSGLSNAALAAILAQLAGRTGISVAVTTP